ncbi:hypothetical protein GPK34_00990 [Secundilactobacillus kimchicus]|uniref:hypothetical protein n=1 Tax=Secundilactobacillus kimchicus TaxID=528209 RepID=UPI001C031FD8|nr:hypothetical protein [Secundilactobacillus kimchicus]MBT9670613.1 hypothetical protein [Secundilactobacillus kimchicus]
MLKTQPIETLSVGDYVLLKVLGVATLGQVVTTAPVQDQPMASNRDDTPTPEAVSYGLTNLSTGDYLISEANSLHSLIETIPRRAVVLRPGNAPIGLKFQVGHPNQVSVIEQPQQPDKQLGESVKLTPVTSLSIGDLVVLDDTQSPLELGLVIQLASGGTENLNNEEVAADNPATDAKKGANPLAWQPLKPVDYPTEAKPQKLNYGYTVVALNTGPAITRQTDSLAALVVQVIKRFPNLKLVEATDGLNNSACMSVGSATKDRNNSNSGTETPPYLLTDNTTVSW